MEYEYNLFVKLRTRILAEESVDIFSLSENLGVVHKFFVFIHSEETMNTLIDSFIKKNQLEIKKFINQKNI